MNCSNIAAQRSSYAPLRRELIHRINVSPKKMRRHVMPECFFRASIDFLQMDSRINTAGMTTHFQTAIFLTA